MANSGSCQIPDTQPKPETAFGLQQLPNPFRSDSFRLGPLVGSTAPESFPAFGQGTINWQDHIVSSWQGQTLSRQIPADLRRS